MTVGLRAATTSGALQVGGVDAVLFDMTGVTLPAEATAAKHAVPFDQLQHYSFPYRNRLINSDMSVNQIYNPTQAASGTAVTPTATQWVADQWQAVVTQASKLTFQQVSDAPAGLKYSTKISVASQFSPGATDQFSFVQNIEGQNIIDFQLGTAGAVTILTSEWVKGSVAGTYAVSVRNGANNRSYVGTVSVTTGWQRLAISLVGDTSGVWATDNTAGLSLAFDLGSGSNFNTTAGSWQAGNFTRTVGSVTFVNQVAGSTLNITGVQVEKGITGQTIPADFEFLAYADQLHRALRYLPCFNSVNGAGTDTLGSAYGTSTTSAIGVVNFPVSTRTPPTGIIVSNAAHILVAGAASAAATSVAYNSAGLTSALINIGTAGSLAVAGGYPLRFANTAGQLYFTGAQL